MLSLPSLALFLTLALPSAPPQEAQPAPARPERPRVRLEQRLRIDRDGDGSWSAEERQAARQRVRAKLEELGQRSAEIRERLRAHTAERGVAPRRLRPAPEPELEQRRPLLERRMERELLRRRIQRHFLRQELRRSGDGRPVPPPEGAPARVQRRGR